MAGRTVPETVAAALDSPEFQMLIGELEQKRTVGRRGYGVRALLKNKTTFPICGGAGDAFMRSFGLQDLTDRTFSRTMSWTADQEEIKPSWGCVQGRS